MNPYRIAPICNHCGDYDVDVRSLVPDDGHECRFTGASCNDCNSETCSVHGFRCGHLITCPVIPGGRLYRKEVVR